MNKIDRLELGWLAARPVVRLKIIDREREREREACKVNVERILHR